MKWLKLELTSDAKVLLNSDMIESVLLHEDKSIWLFTTKVDVPYKLKNTVVNAIRLKTVGIDIERLK